MSAICRRWSLQSMRSEFAIKLALVGFKQSELLHEALVWLSLLSVKFAVLECIIEAETKSSHQIHDERCGTSWLAHGAVDQDAICDLFIYCFVVRLDATVVFLLGCHLNGTFVCVPIELYRGLRVWIGHLFKIYVSYWFLWACLFCVNSNEFIDFLKHIWNGLVILVGDNKLQIC